MKNIILLAIVLFVTGFVGAQSWKDSLRLGKKYYQEGNYKQAYQSLLEAQKLAPSEIDLSQDIGNAAYRSQDYEMAEKAFRAAASNGEDERLFCFVPNSKLFAGLFIVPLSAVVTINWNK